VYITAEVEPSVVEFLNILQRKCKKPTRHLGATKGLTTHPFPSLPILCALLQDITFAQVCTTAGVKPSEVGYVEAHGTGTVVGDGQELGAIDGWYGKAAGRGAHSPLLLGSVKSNMGHCEGASGLAGNLYHLFIFLLLLLGSVN
jgi:fatty acid synthase